jgi:hypothetical protein
VILVTDPVREYTEHQLHITRTKRGGALGSNERPSQRQSIAKSVAPRIPPSFPTNKYEATRDEIDEFCDLIDVPTPTRRDVIDQLVHVSVWNSTTRGGFQMHPFLALLRMIKTDTDGFFRTLKGALDEISKDSLDDYLMTKRLEGWRKTMNDMSINVPSIGQSARHFARFAFQSNSDADLPDEVRVILADIDQMTEQMQNRLNDAYTALRSDM